MIYLKVFLEHISYEDKVNVVGGRRLYSNVTSMDGMFEWCSKLKTITMKGCSEATIQKITDVKPSGATIVTGQTI